MILSSHGKAKTSLVKKIDSEEEDKTLVDQDIPSAEVETEYDLSLIQCQKGQAQDWEMAITYDFSDGIHDDLLARFNES